MAPNFNTPAGYGADGLFSFDLQQFAINSGSGGNSLPAGIIGVIEQQNYLETKLRRAIRPTRVLRASIPDSGIEYFDGRIGETKTFTRSNEIAPNVTPMNPANNTGLDNGISLDSRGFEQWLATLYSWPGGLNLNLLGNETLIGDLWVDDMVKLVEKAGNSLELVVAQRALQAYDSGDTFVTVAVSSSQNTLKVDNLNGFTTQYTSTNAPSYGLPQPVSTSNKLPIQILSSTGTVLYSGNVQGTAADGSNVSYAQMSAIVVGISGTLTLDFNVTTVPLGARVVAMDSTYTQLATAYNATYKDGSYVVRPLSSGVMIPSAYQMTAASTLAPSVQFPLAAALLRRRNVPKLANGLYGVAVDSTLMSYLYQDSGFQVATQGTWDRSPVFTNGIIAKGWGLEFVEDTQLPVYLAPTGGFNLRHAFAFGSEVISEHPFAALKAARDKAAHAGDIVDVRFLDRIEFITQAPLDRLNEVVKMSYKYVGDFEPGTDKGSNPNTVLTSDWCRFKRGVLIQAASSV